MMRGIQLHFNSEGAKFNLEYPVSGFSSTVQNALVNIGQKISTDITYPTKGSDIHNSATTGGIVSPDVFETKLYELAGETQDFINDTEERDFNKNELSALEIELEIWDVDKARVQVTATSSQGETIGNTSEI